MKRKIIIGLSAIFFVVFVGGGLIASFMNTFNNYYTAYYQMDGVIRDIQDIHTKTLIAVGEIERARDEPGRLQELLGQITDINFSLSRLEQEVNPDLVANKGCGMCHDDPESLVSNLSQVLSSFEKTFDDFTMAASMLITRGEDVSSEGFKVNLQKDLDQIYDIVYQLNKVTRPMMDHIHIEMDNNIARIGKFNTTTVIITILLVLGGMILTITAVTKPIRKLTRGTEAIVQGDYDFRIELPGKDEMTLLAERFNYMAEVLSNRERRLLEKREELQELNETLEKKVQDRTVALREKQEEVNRKYLELESTNEELQASYVQLQSTAAELEEAQSRLQENYDILQTMNKELRRANDVKNKFLSIMSHELRTPLTVINGYLSLVLEKNYGKPTKALRDILVVVKEQGTNQLNLIEDLLDLTRIESGEYRLDRQPCDPVEMMKKIIESFKPKMDEKNITVTLDVEGTVTQVYWDYQKILQIFQNLMDNAQKFTPNGGWVALSIKPKIDFVEFRISDNGIGIPKDQQNNIFDRFYQVDSSSTRRFGGSGLGLSIVREIVLAHNGKIFLDSEEERGTTFLILLPPGDPGVVSADQEDMIEEKGGTAALGSLVDGKGEKILVVDDDEAFLSMMSMILSKYGYDAYTTTDSKSVVDAVKENGIQIVLLDLMMPDLDGYEVTRRLKRDRATRDVPIIVVSASGGKEISKKIKDAGGDDHLIKPFDHDEILNLISDYLEKGTGDDGKAARNPGQNDGGQDETTG